MSDREDPAVEGADKAFAAHRATMTRASPGRAWAGSTVTGEDSPEDVGDSEDEEGRTTEGTQGAFGRPYGKTGPEGSSGVEPQGPVTEGPNLPSP